MPIVIDTNLIKRKDSLLKEGCIVPKISTEQELRNVEHPCNEVPNPKGWDRYTENIMLRDLKGVCRKTATFPPDMKKCLLELERKWFWGGQTAYEYMKKNHPHSKLKGEFNTFKRGNEVDSAFLRTAEEHNVKLATGDRELFDECIEKHKKCLFREER